MLESEQIVNTDYIYEILFLELGPDNRYLLCFTKNQLLILEADTLQIYQVIENDMLLGNNISVTMSSSLKAVYVAREDIGNIMIAVVDQSSKTPRVLSVFILEFC